MIRRWRLAFPDLTVAISPILSKLDPTAVRSQILWMLDPMAVRSPIACMLDPTAVRSPILWMLNPMAVRSPIVWMLDPTAVRSPIVWMLDPTAVVTFLDQTVVGGLEALAREVPDPTVAIGPPGSDGRDYWLERREFVRTLEPNLGAVFVRVTTQLGTDGDRHLSSEIEGIQLTSFRTLCHTIGTNFQHVTGTKP